MFAHESSVRGEEKDCTIKRSTVTLDDADDQEHPGIPRRLPQDITSWTGHIHSAIVVSFEKLTPFRRAEADPGAKVQTFGIG